MAVIFDLDGTIADSEPLHREAYNTVLSRYDIRISPDEWSAYCAGRGDKAAMESILTKKGRLGEADLPGLLHEKRRSIRRLIAERLVPVRGFMAFLAELQRRRIPFLIASNSYDSAIEHELEALKLGDLPHVGIDDVGGRLKPDPAIYEEACRRLGVHPREATVYEDSPPGIIAAKRAGCRCIALRTTNPEAALREAGADAIIKDFTEARPPGVR